MSGSVPVESKDLPIPEPGTVDLWYLNQLKCEEHELARYSKLLSEDERVRAAGFHFEKDRRQFVVARASLRILLGQYLGEDAESLCFSSGLYGKPYLEKTMSDGEAPLHFNVAHSAEHILIGFSISGQLGVDIEALRIGEERMKPLIRNICTEKEKEWAEELSNDDVELGLSRLWTAKEAALKAVGSGFQIPPDQMEIEKEILRGGGGSYLARSSRFGAGPVNDVFLFPMSEFESECGCSAAVALRGSGRSIAIHRK